MHETLSSNIMLRFFEKIYLGETVSKRKKLDLFLKIFRNFQNFENRDSSFVALLILRHVI